jgi:hypothetical protein
MARITADLDRLSMGALPYPCDQLIDPAMACSLHADACRDHALVAAISDPAAHE